MVVRSDEEEEGKNSISPMAFVYSNKKRFYQCITVKIKYEQLRLKKVMSEGGRFSTVQAVQSKTLPGGKIWRTNYK